MARSNQEVGDTNHANLAAYLEQVGPNLPRRPSGDLDVARIVREAPLTARRVFYDVDRNVRLVDDHLRKHNQTRGAPGVNGAADTNGARGTAAYDRPGAATTTDNEARLKRQLGDVERRLAAALGEVREVRQKLRRYEAIEIHLADTGRLPR